MNFLVVSGAPNTGKTTAVNFISEWICNRHNITSDINGNPLPAFHSIVNGRVIDISFVINIHGRIVIIHSATDDRNLMDVLTNLIKSYPNADTVITTCRDINWERIYFTNNIRPFATNYIESPLAKVTRRINSISATNWYQSTLLNLHQHILINNPFSF